MAGVTRSQKLFDNSAFDVWFVSLSPRNVLTQTEDWNSPPLLRKRVFGLWMSSWPFTQEIYPADSRRKTTFAVSLLQDTDYNHSWVFICFEFVPRSWNISFSLVSRSFPCDYNFYVWISRPSFLWTLFCVHSLKCKNVVNLLARNKNS